MLMITTNIWFSICVHSFLPYHTSLDRYRCPCFLLFVIQMVLNSGSYSIFNDNMYSAFASFRQYMLTFSFHQFLFTVWVHQFSPSPYFMLAYMCTFSLHQVLFSVQVHQFRACPLLPASLKSFERKREQFSLIILKRLMCLQ